MLVCKPRFLRSVTLNCLICTVLFAAFHSHAELFDAPQAFFFGSLTSLIGGRDLPDQIMVVDLDKNRIVSAPAFEPLPWHLSWRLWESIVQNMGYYQHYCPTASLNVPANLPPHAALLADDTGSDATHASSPTSSFSSLFSSAAADSTVYSSAVLATSHRTSIAAHVASHVALPPSLPLGQSEQSRQLPRRLSYVRARSATVPSVNEVPSGVPSWLVHRNSGPHSSLLRIENATVSMLGRGGQQSGPGASAPGAPPRARSAALPDPASTASSTSASSTVNAHDAGATPLPKRPSLFSAALEQFLAPRRGKQTHVNLLFCSLGKIYSHPSCFVCTPRTLNRSLFSNNSHSIAAHTAQCK